VTTSVTNGKKSGKNETLTFDPATGCGEATLQTTDGTQESVTLHHCI